MTTGFKKWTSIEKFSDAVIFAHKNFIKTVFYRDKVKLHGTNAGVRIEPDLSVFYQKRTSDVTIGDDNAGFANWATTKNNIWKNINRMFGEDKTYILWGEWAGPGIASGDAVCHIPNKTFFLFSVEVIGSENTFIVSEPDTILNIVNFNEIGDIMVLPWAGEAKKIRFYGDNTEDGITPTEYAEYINEKVDGMETLDPYIYMKYLIEKSGEGYVCYPSLGDFDNIERGLFGAMVFKAKTSAHSANKTKGAKVRIEVPSSVIDFADTYVSESRCEQMIREHCNGEYTMRNTPVFLRALIADIEKESVNEREAGNIDMQSANKVISAKAVKWLKEKTELV